MNKKLTEMTNEERWHLFPIQLTPHKAIWQEWFELEKQVLEKVLTAQEGISIFHIGSTAVTNIWAKPIVDILMQLPKETSMEKMAAIMEKQGYTNMSTDDLRISLNKGYTIHGFAEKVFHLHLCYEGDIDEVYFCQYLKEHEETALAYQNLKRNLWKKYQYNRDAYTNEKGAFIREYTEKAKQEYKF